jgi:hypothetical protein
VTASSPPDWPEAARLRLVARIQTAIEGQDAALSLDVLLAAAAHCIGIIADNGKNADSLLQESQLKMEDTLRREWSRLQELRRQALANQKGE